ncbi:MAG: ParB/RepB/Spo0J family partition protein [Candidatus Zixiibacteriota bacterium]|nr:MAG: ParB/RepB/Spo0J family partition protein [candidate division Zixibacteria bacterium]
MNGKDKKESRLGKGLAALLPEGADLGGRAPRFAEIEVDRVRANPQQPRTTFDEGALKDLADSIRAKGVVQPIIVRRAGGEYELIAGERRLRASRLAGLERIPAFIAEVADGSESLELALIENLQREDLNALEQAEGFHRLAEEHGLTQEEIARRVGKSRAAVANTVRLLNLSTEVQASLRSGDITAGHARAILAFDDPDRQATLWKRIMKEGLSVRKAEALARKLASSEAEPPAPAKKKSPHVSQVEDRLRTLLGTHVRLHHKPGKGGSIEIEYYSDEDLERLLELFDLMEKNW